MGDTFFGEAQEENNEKDTKECFGDSGASSHITHKNKEMTDVEKCDINVTMGNGQKMKCKLKGYINMKLNYGQTVKLTEVLYVPQTMKNLLSVSRLITKGATMGATQDKTTIKKNGVSTTLDERKRSKQEHHVLLEGEKIFSRRTRCTHQYSRTEK